MAETVVAVNEAAAIKELAVEVVEDTKGKDLVCIDLSQRPGSLFDTMIICTATSSRHAAAIAERLRVALKRAGIAIVGIEGPGEMGWTLIDAGSVVTHIFLESAREHYDLESLWALPE